MTAQFLPVQPFDLVVFGGTGDLAMRKLLPGLYHRDCDEQLPAESRIIGIGRSALDAAAYAKRVEEALPRFVEAERLNPETMARFLKRLHYVRMDGAGEEGAPDLVALLAAAPERIRVIYLATGPDLFGPICRNLDRIGLVTPATRVVLEKPLGHDTQSARAINDTVAEVFSEEQTYRIDHYLGKETVQNLITLRFANVLLEPRWNSAAIDHVQITVSETLGVGSRGEYYDHSGALRDMVQNHLLQLLCLVAMEPPSSLDADAVRDEKLKVLRALKPIADGEVQRVTVRGQYRAGAIEGVAVPGYLQELGRNESTTETYVALKAEIGNWRWAGVPFYLRTGKRLAGRSSDIVVQFRCVPHSIFGEATDQLVANRLVVRLQPDEGVKLFLMCKDPGPGGLRFRNVPLNLTFAETFTVRNPDSYERLLMDVVRGNQTLFMRRDEVAAAWAWIDPIRRGWEETRLRPKPYTSGSWGPSDATALMARDGRAWLEDALDPI
ncbi:MAG: glucose-6-phosphate dehydrogenase [Dongiaceae bacterium]